MRVATTNGLLRTQALPQAFLSKQLEKESRAGVACGNLMWRGARLGLERKAIVLVVGRQSQVEPICAQALRATFPRLVAADQGAAQVVVDPDGTLDSDEVPVTVQMMETWTPQSRILGYSRLLQKRSRRSMKKKTSEPLSGEMDGSTKGQLGTFRSQ